MQIFYRLIRKNPTSVRQRMGWHYWLIGCLMWAFLLPKAQGEGSVDFINYGDARKGEELFELALDLEDRVFDSLQNLEAIYQTLQTLTALAPDPDAEFEDEEDED